jgi:antirestriction protein ArdC
LDYAQQELEAESVAYIVCERNGVSPKSQTYLSHFVESNTTTDSIDLFQIMRTAGQVETVLELSAHTKFGKAHRK